MQSNPRILVNLLVILVKILVNLLVKLTKLGQGGPWGGYPLYEASSRLYPRPQQGGAMGLGRARGTKALGTLVGSTCSPTKGPHQAYCETLVGLLRDQYQDITREIDGYPFTTFTDSSDFLASVLPSVSVTSQSAKCMEEYYKQSDQLTCNPFQNISKFTSNISKHTSKSTSETN